MARCFCIFRYHSAGNPVMKPTRRNENETQKMVIHAARTGHGARSATDDDDSGWDGLGELHRCGR